MRQTKIGVKPQAHPVPNVKAKRSWWCRIGLHHWAIIGPGAPHSTGFTLRCTRPDCGRIEVT